jgi:hypothetical protein
VAATARARVLRIGAAFLAAALSGCAGDLVVRAPHEPASRATSVLRQAAPLRVAVSRVAGAPPSDAPVGVRAKGPFTGEVPILLTEDVGTVVRRTVVDELRAAGLEAVDQGGDVYLGIELHEFAVDAPRSGNGWDVQVRIRLGLRVSKAPGAEAFDEFELTAERSRQRAVAPDVGSVERVLAECLADLGDLLADREALAAALARHAAPAGRAAAGGS